MSVSLKYSTTKNISHHNKNRVQFSKTSDVKSLPDSDSKNVAPKNHINYEWLKLATKDILIDFLLKKKWTSRNKTELQKSDVEEIRQKVKTSLQKYGSLKEIQQFEEKVNSTVKKKEKQRETKLSENRKRKEYCLELGKKVFIPGARVWVFDEKPSSKDPIKHIYFPIKARVISQENEGKSILVEFRETRRWHEAGGHWIHKGQTLQFKFDPITCTWLREGLTPEVVRTIGPDGRSRYFELSYTRQFLILPDVADVADMKSTSNTNHSQSSIVL
jgi:hypothetical protein